MFWKCAARRLELRPSSVSESIRNAYFTTQPFLLLSPTGNFDFGVSLKLERFWPKANWYVFINFTWCVERRSSRWHYLRESRTNNWSCFLLEVSLNCQNCDLLNSALNYHQIVHLTLGSFIKLHVSSGMQWLLGQQNFKWTLRTGGGGGEREGGVWPKHPVDFKRGKSKYSWLLITRTLAN